MSKYTLMESVIEEFPGVSGGPWRILLDEETQTGGLVPAELNLEKAIAWLKAKSARHEEE